MIIALIHDGRHVGFQIVMQISHVLCWGANIGKKANCGKSARRNIEITFLKVHLSPHFSLKKNIEVTCVIILFYYLSEKHSMNVKKIVCVAKTFVKTSRTCVVCPLRSV